MVYDFSIVNPPAEVCLPSWEWPKTTLPITSCAYARSMASPIVIEYTYMPLELIPGLKKKDLYASVYSYIREQCGLKISSFHRNLHSCRGGTEEEAKRLNIQASGSPLELNHWFLDSGAVLSTDFAQRGRPL